MMWIALVKILSDTDVLQFLGWTFAIAAIMGAILDNHGRDLMRWLLAVSTFAALNGIGSIVVMNTTSFDVVAEVIDFVLIFTFVYCLGLSGGWFIYKLGQKNAVKKYIERKAAEEKISITQVRRNEKAREKLISEKSEIIEGVTKERKNDANVGESNSDES